MNEIGESIYCRVCLRTDRKVRKKCSSLFAKYKDSSLHEIINSIADVKIHQDDGLPSMICPDCLLELNTAVGFKTKCENSDILLKTKISSNNQLIKHESTPVKSLEEIKQEEPVEPEEYLEAEYLDEECHYPENDFAHQTETNLEFEAKPESEPSDQVPTKENNIVKKSKAIDLKLECNECGGFFKSKCKMKVHWKKVHMCDSLTCPICKRVFKSYKAFNHHKNSKTTACMIASQVRVEGVGKARVYHCKNCSYSSKRVLSLQAHLTTHTGDRPYVCNICSKGFSQHSALQSHRETTHKIYLAETTCTYCGKHLKGRGAIYSHMKTHRNETFQCDICKKKLKSKIGLVAHLKRHSGVKSLTCEKCAKPFFTYSDLSNHRRTVHEKGLHIYKCDICGYKTIRTVTLNKHKSRHTSTNVPCLECGRFFEDSQQLVAHQRIHFGERNYPCPHCEKKYFDRKARSKHVTKIHKCKLLNKPIKQEVAESSCSPTTLLIKGGGMLISAI